MNGDKYESHLQLSVLCRLSLPVYNLDRLSFTCTVFFLSFFLSPVTVLAI